MKTKTQEKNNSLVVQAPPKAATIHLLNYLLAHCIDLKLQAKQAHWNLKGENFMALHTLFDQIATEVNEYADLLAERAKQLGGMAQGTLQAVEKDSCLPAYPAHITDSQQHVLTLHRAMCLVSEKVCDAIDKITALENDAVTIDICTEIARGLDRSSWFLHSHITAKM